MAKRIQAVRIALGLKGTPFRHQGRDPASGLDCAGVVLHVAEKTGASIDAPDDYSRAARGGFLQGILEKRLRCVTRDPLPGDVVAFWLKNRYIIRHIGVVVASGFIHANENSGVMLQSWTPNWEKRIHSVYEFPHIED